MSGSKNIAFLFGAGISIPAKMLSTADITKKILNGKIAYVSSRFFEVEDTNQLS